MGVILTYNNTQILSLDDSANKTIKTGGKYCSHDISLQYVKQPGGIAAIYVTYPEGWICSCSNGQVAEDTSGEYMFFVAELGTYTVTATNGTLSKSATANVTNKWRNYDVPIQFSYIHVTYPVGSICTCTYGTQVQTATDTSGEFTFIALQTGTYSINTINGTSESTDTVNVSQYGTTYDLNVEFEYVIYREGVFRQGVQEQSISGFKAPTKNSNNIYFHPDYSSPCGIRYLYSENQKIHRKLYLDMEFASLSSYNEVLTIAVSSSSGSAIFQKTFDYSGTTRTINEFELGSSSIIDGRITIQISKGSFGAYARIYGIWLT